MERTEYWIRGQIISIYLYFMLPAIFWLLWAFFSIFKCDYEYVLALPTHKVAFVEKLKWGNGHELLYKDKGLHSTAKRMLSFLPLDPCWHCQGAPCVWGSQPLWSITSGVPWLNQHVNIFFMNIKDNYGKGANLGRWCGWGRNAIQMRRLQETRMCMSPSPGPSLTPTWIHCLYITANMH